MRHLPPQFPRNTPVQLQPQVQQQPQNPQANWQSWNTPQQASVPMVSVASNNRMLMYRNNQLNQYRNNSGGGGGGTRIVADETRNMTPGLSQTAFSEPKMDNGLWYKKPQHSNNSSTSKFPDGFDVQSYSDTLETGSNLDEAFKIPDTKSFKGRN